MNPTTRLSAKLHRRVCLVLTEDAVLAEELLARKKLATEVAGRLVKPRTNQPVAELLDRSAAALTNPPVIDRRIKDLPPAARKLLALVGLSRRPRWKVGHLITLLASLGHAEGFAPVRAALEAGLLFPERPADGRPLD